MFYYPNVLNHKTGCFATIWLAATKARKMNRRDLLKVNVQSTCTDIMDYVLVRVPSLAAGLPRPRFSLYLSSQLQYGIVLVFHRQCQLLLEEIQEAIDRLHRYHVQAQIDMVPEEIRQTQTLPDALALLTETEGARDPFFGSIEFGLPSPTSLMQLAQELGVVSPESLHSPPVEGITASQESITMTERQPVIMQEPEFEGAELQEINMIEMLLEQSDQFPEGDEETGREAERARKRERRERDREREEVLEREREREAAEVERTRDLTGSTLMELAQSTEVPSRDIVSVGEEVDLPTAMPEPAARERTPEPVTIPPSPPTPERRELRRESPRLEELVPIPEAPAERRRRRKRQLVFMDEEIQISQDALQAQINDPSIEIRPLEDVLIRPPSEVSEPKVLLSNPCMKLPAEILELWKQGAVIPHIPPPRRHREGEEDLEAVRERERGREEQEEGELREMPTEIVESGVSRYDTPVSSLVMEVTDREISPLETPETRRSPVPVSVCGLEDIPEERVPELEDVMMDVDPLKRLAALGEDEATFHSVLPPKVTRRTISQAFWRLLERIDMKEVTVRQDKPYGDIIIYVTQQPRQIEMPPV
ncbi:meiotic recombination protein REC8 homolog isoform X1 [Tachysurus fulvidraco]|uniref:meiotic recombination protein REC8 homolog isoform X1 n=1 Tax=Tachysurus fulvidraco TaxID=1234273 RepID=UPI001FEE0A83|nr:meiotic recombination protein REC8 homolog isoform X1 [Tachysurus fulvidraco]